VPTCSMCSEENEGCCLVAEPGVGPGRCSTHQHHHLQARRSGSDRRADWQFVFTRRAAGSAYCDPFGSGGARRQSALNISNYLAAKFLHEVSDIGTR
jgi:hypothetical protein